SGVMRGQLLACAFLVMSVPPALARPPVHSEPRLTDAGIAEVKTALDEHRFVDAGAMLDQANQSGVKDGRLGLMMGDLEMARGQYLKALADYRASHGVPDQRGWALRGEG